MAKPNISRMDVPSLMALRRRIDAKLMEHRAALQKQLDALDEARGLRARGGGRDRAVSRLKGRKIAPKYRGPSGETWAGRGARPRWLAEALKGGRRIEDFLIDKFARKRVKRRRKAKR
jgi:DNA-binding protein H-NS